MITIHTDESEYNVVAEVRAETKRVRLALVADRTYSVDLTPCEAQSLAEVLRVQAGEVGSMSGRYVG